MRALRGREVRGALRPRPRGRRGRVEVSLLLFDCDLVLLGHDAHVRHLPPAAAVAEREAVRAVLPLPTAARSKRDGALPWLRALPCWRGARATKDRALIRALWRGVRAVGAPLGEACSDTCAEELPREPGTVAVLVETTQAQRCMPEAHAWASEGPGYGRS